MVHINQKIKFSAGSSSTFVFRPLFLSHWGKEVWNLLLGTSFQNFKELSRNGARKPNNNYNCCVKPILTLACPQTLLNVCGQTILTLEHSQIPNTFGSFIVGKNNLRRTMKYFSWRDRRHSHKKIYADANQISTSIGIGQMSNDLFLTNITASHVNNFKVTRLLPLQAVGKKNHFLFIELLAVSEHQLFKRPVRNESSQR